MGEIRIHRSDPARFVKIPNDTMRDTRLSWAGRGYLGEMLSNKADWEPESGPEAARRARNERSDAAESGRQVIRIHAELEREGYRHRLRRPGPRGLFINEVHYYDVPTVPCEDPWHCAGCGTDPAELRGRSELARRDVPAGGTDPAELTGRSPADPAEPRSRPDQAIQAVSAGGTDSALTEGSDTAGSNRRPCLPEDNAEEQQRATQARPPGPTTMTDKGEHVDDQQPPLDLGPVATVKAPAKRGTRIPPDILDRLRADQVFITWIRDECPGVNVRREMEKFVDHFTAASGPNAAKRDWTAAARNWLRRAQDDAGQRSGQNGANGQGCARCHGGHAPGEQCRDGRTVCSDDPGYAHRPGEICRCGS
jgi:hypothetical protein